MAQAKKADAEAVEEIRNGVNKSLYLSKTADAILARIEKATPLSQSAIVSLMIQRFGPEIERDPRKLMVSV
jgi:hypothetical protein